MEDLVIPNHFLCPISLDLMRDPVTLSSGITYDRDSIEKWLQGGNFTCPVTKQTLTSFDMIPNHTLRKMTQEWCVKNLQFGVERIPTPRVPVTPFEVSRTLSKLSESARSGDLHGCMDLVKKIKNWGEESDRNRKCIVGNRAAETLAATFERFADESITRHSMLLGEILGVVDWMFPLDLEALGYFGRPSSISCLVRFLETGDLSVRKTAAFVLKELSSDPSYVDVTALVEAGGVLVNLIEHPISAAITKTSLTIIFNLISSTQRNEEIQLRFVEAGLVEILIETLVESERSVSEKTAIVLFKLCSCEEGRARACRHSLTVPVLVKKILRVSELATEYSVSTLLSLIRNCLNWDDQGRIIVEMLQVGVFQKLLLLLQIECGVKTKEKATELLKLLNPYRAGIECIESTDFKSLKRSF